MVETFKISNGIQKSLKGRINMKKQLIILGVAVLLICIGLSGCFGETESKNLDKRFIGTWKSATLQRQRTFIFYSDGTGRFMEDSTEWEMKDGKLFVYFPVLEFNITYDFEFIQDNQDNEILILTDVVTGLIDDYKRQ